MSVSTKQVDRAIEAALREQDKIDSMFSDDYAIYRAANILQYRAGRVIKGAYDRVEKRFKKLYGGVTQ